MRDYPDPYLPTDPARPYRTIVGGFIAAAIFAAGLVTGLVIAPDPVGDCAPPDCLHCPEPFVCMAPAPTEDTP